MNAVLALQQLDPEIDTTAAVSSASYKCCSRKPS
jgi:hypothetical protein